MPAIQYRARADRAREQAGAPRQPTSTHNTARAEEKRGEEEEEEEEELSLYLSLSILPVFSSLFSLFSLLSFFLSPFSCVIFALLFRYLVLLLVCFSLPVVSNFPRLVAKGAPTANTKVLRKRCFFPAGVWSLALSS